MNLDEFVKNYLGKATDYDGGMGTQCVDLIKLYLDKVFNIKIGAIGNAEAYYRRYDEVPLLKNNFDRIANTPNFVPQRGDICIFGTALGKYGHICIATGEGDTSYFNSWDQNWGSKEMKEITHNYNGFLGVLRYKNKEDVSKNETTEKVVQEENLDDLLFDADLYYSLYPDLQKAFGNNKEALYNHWLTFGINEGRRGSYVFDVHYYFAAYEDLRKAIGPNCRELYNHFKVFGIKEGRKASNEFEVGAYAYFNKDLKDAYGADYKKHIEHFIKIGISELRKTSSTFNVEIYKNNYADLRDAFGNNIKDYYKHYIMYGATEGRKAI